MKKIYIRTALFLGLVLLAAGCNWFPDSSDGGEIPENAVFYTGCPLMFYFVDENKQSLVDIDDLSTYPTAFAAPASEEARLLATDIVQRYQSESGTIYLYNSESNSLQWDNSEGMFGFQTYFWGITPQTNYSMPVYLFEYLGVLTIGYKYVTTSGKVQVSGASWAVEILSARLDGVDILTNNTPGKVFIEIPSQGGEPVVHVGSF